MSDFRKGLLYTAAPIVALSLLSILRRFWFLFNWLWAIAAVGILVALVAAIVLGRRSRSLAAGIFAGIGIGIVSLGVTCFANLFSESFWM